MGHGHRKRRKRARRAPKETPVGDVADPVPMDLPDLPDLSESHSDEYTGFSSDADSDNDEGIVTSPSHPILPTLKQFKLRGNFQQNSSTVTHMTTNKYNNVTNEEGEFSGSGQSTRGATTAQKKVRIPPIVLPGVSYKQLKSSLQEIIGKRSNIQIMPFGSKLVPRTEGDFNAIQNTLKKSKIPFYTYERESEKPVKFVLSGLPNIPVDDIKTELKEHNLNPIDVKTMRLKTTRFEDESKYLLHFKKGDVNLNRLKQIRYIQYFVVRWDYYRNTNNGPTQCRRCQGFRHGSKNCHLDYKCVICSQSLVTSKKQEAPWEIHRDTPILTLIVRLPMYLLMGLCTISQHSGQWYPK